MRNICLFLMVAVLTACTHSTPNLIEPSKCDNLDAFKASLVEYFPGMLRLSSQGRTVSLDLSKNELTCSASKGPLQFSFSGIIAQSAQADVIELVDGKSKIHVRQVLKSKSQEFDTYVSENCVKAKLPFIFSVKHASEKIIGCQSTELSKSAVMWREQKTSQSMVEIAMLPIYKPIIDLILEETATSG